MRPVTITALNRVDGAQQPAESVAYAMTLDVDGSLHRFTFTFTVRPIAGRQYAIITVHPKEEWRQLFDGSPVQTEHQIYNAVKRLQRGDLVPLPMKIT